MDFGAISNTVREVYREVGEKGDTGPTGVPGSGRSEFLINKCECGCHV
jgi:putative protein kinase ArgK-like GTPase of G3E family